MDPLTQGVLGTVAAQQFAKPKLLLSASILGFLSGMAPDLDIFIRSSTDPLLALEFHRQFTHSLFFIPFGGFLCALFFFLVLRPFKSQLTFKQLWLYCTVGYATHGLLDACTTYGTQLFWPLTDTRVAWNTISIIDPLFTLPLLVLMIFAAKNKSRRIAVVGVCWVVIYSLFGVVQRERAEAMGWEVAKQRGDVPLRLEAKPSFANLLVWKVVYTTEENFHVDAIRVAWQRKLYAGESISKLNVSRDFSWLDPESQQARDIERFRWFSNGYVAVSAVHPNRIIDVRYSLLPNEIKGMWGIELSKNAGKQSHIHYVTDHSRNASTFMTLWSMILGE
jgi:inner membrane protein